LERGEGKPESSGFINVSPLLQRGVRGVRNSKKILHG